MLDNFLANTRRFIPEKIFNYFQPKYHWCLAFFAALIYRFPSRKIKVIGVTGTKGKSSTVEIINSIMEEAGYKTAISSTIHFKIGDKEERNLYKMTMPGRFFVQKILRRAVNAKCDYMIMEMTSQGALLYRHLFIDLDVFVFTNLAKEHIESHGSYEKYRDAKVSIAQTLASSKKKNRIIIANSDDKESKYFLDCFADKKITFSLNEAEPYRLGQNGIDFTFAEQKIHSPLVGEFNLYNILAGIKVAQSQGVNMDIVKKVIEKLGHIAGRVEEVKVSSKQDFKVIVDYAHTPDSLEQLYKAFRGAPCICVLGGTGGGRDNWKRKEMGKIADNYCKEIILTDEDPYDENPKQIVDQICQGIEKHKPEIIMDRREAISRAIALAKNGDNILITGKGTDPYIMEPRNTKTPWSDKQVAKEELEKKFS